MLKGYRTYLFATAIAIVTVVHYLGYMSADVYALFLGVLAPGGAMAMRAAIRG